MGSLKQDCQKLRDFFTGPETWTKGSTSTGKGYCLSEACLAIARKDRTFESRHTILYISLHLPEKFRNKDPKVGGYVGAFNDDPDTTFEMIVAFLDKCVEAAPNKTLYELM